MYDLVDSSSNILQHPQWISDAVLEASRFLEVKLLSPLLGFQKLQLKKKKKMQWNTNCNIYIS